jgi:prepilin-type processing-associated H-X9-DG protein
VTPFIGGSSGTDVYSEPTFGNAAERFFYPTERDLLPSDRLGPGQIVSNASTLNAVGRHHEGSSSATTREGQGGFGGTANFVFVDGHVERAHVRDTVRDRKWGRRFYSLTGPGTKVNLEANPWP